MPDRQVIHIHPHAPAKPPMGAACNGCGVCCLAEPCPLGILLSLRRTGPCKALRWSDLSRQYRCGALDVPAPPWWKGFWARWVARWIAAGTGCDCELETPSTPTMRALRMNASESPHDG